MKDYFFGEITVADKLETQEPTQCETIEFKVYLSEDRAEVLVDCPDPLNSLNTYVSMVIDEFERMGLPEYPDPTILREMMNRSASAGIDFVRQVLILGTKTEPTIHGHLQWTRDFFADGWVVDQETDTIDFREKIENCTVRRNELLVRRSEPKEGIQGLDVFGNPIPVEKPEMASIRCGKGVTEVVSPGMINYYADIDGRVNFKDNTVGVEEVFAIHGDIDLKSGNIHHTGTITIDGDIRNGARVEAEGDILVKGMIEQSDIKCGGTLTVAGGIIGDEEHVIEVGGNVVAKYIRDADVAANGDIIVTKEILHSNVRTQGCVFIPNGRIAGGTTTALKGIRVATAGAPGSTDTLLLTGVDFSLQDRIALFLEKITHLETIMEPVQAALKNAEQSEDSSNTTCVVIEELSDRRMLIGQSISIEYMRVEELTQNTDDEAVNFIIINKEVWSGTTIRLGENTFMVKRSINKPRIALLKGEKIHVVPLGVDNMPADDICSPAPAGS